MENLSLNDPTQLSVQPHVRNTEALLARAASLISGSEQSANTWIMPDLSLPRDISRVFHGIYCGTLYSWESKEPMVPVDSNAISCGVSVFKLNDSIGDYPQFARRITDAMRISKEHSTYEWNFGHGNHFIIYGSSEGSEDLPAGNYAFLHSSSSEFKKQHNGLYPTEGNWYSEDVETIQDETIHRHLRFIRGRVAERFIKLAQSLETYNQQRHRYFADLVFGAHNIDEEICNVQHYGMPTENSVAIGCQWTRGRVLPLLTAPEKPVYLVRPHEGGENDVTVGGKKLLLFPHGLGRRAQGGIDIQYTPSGMLIDGKFYPPDATMKGEDRLQFRNFEQTEAQEGRVPQIIAQIAKQCSAEILAKVDQIYSYHILNPIPA